MMMMTMWVAEKKLGRVAFGRGLGADYSISHFRPVEWDFGI